MGFYISKRGQSNTIKCEICGDPSTRVNRQQKICCKETCRKIKKDENRANSKAKRVLVK